MAYRRLIVMTLSACALVMETTRALAAQQPAPAAPYPHAAEPIGTVRQIYDGTLTPEMAINTFRNIDRLFPTRRVPRSTKPLPLPAAATPLSTVNFSDRGRQYGLEEFLDLNRVSALLVIQDGRVKLERYRYDNTERTRWMSMSIAKSITSTLIGAAVKQGKLALSDPVTKHVPALAGSAYEGVTVRDVLMMSSGVRWNETYTNPASDRRRLLEAQISQVPGSAMALMHGLPRAAERGTLNIYSTGETQVASEILRSAVGQPLADYLYERIWSRVGMEADADWWLDSPNGTEIGGSGFSATLRDYGRFGLFVLNDGVTGSDSILPSGWIAEASSTKTLRGEKALDYGYLWWPGMTPAARRDHAFAAEGNHGQFVYINPAAKLVVVVWSAQPKPTGGAVIDEWSFFDAVAAALHGPDSSREEALWYLRGERSIHAFIAHADQISIVSPQVFSMDSAGFIRGSVDPRVIATARAKGAKLVPLVMNSGFDQPSIHRVLNNPAARAQALRSLAAMCRDNKLDGIQFDFENFHVSDKNAFTSFTRAAVDSVHRAGCTLSAAVVPRLGENPGDGAYDRWIHDNWRAGFDYKALADTLDFISLMTYAQHTGGSPPGPVAGYPWTLACLKYVLSLGVPANKISIGLAGYSDWWYATYDEKNGSRVRGSDISYSRGMEILSRARVTPVWDDVQKAPYAMWEEHGVFQHMWLEDARAFMAKRELVKAYGLRGYSVWLLGTEDPKVWEPR